MVTLHHEESRREHRERCDYELAFDLLIRPVDPHLSAEADNED